jgi:tRNA (cmo5U34)-methyltransferase
MTDFTKIPDTNLVKMKFDSYAEEYNANRRKFIPHFDEFYNSGIDFLDCSNVKPRVLDLGAGTGLYSHFLLNRYPSAQVTLVDFSEKMLAQARDRFNAHNADITYLCADLSDPSKLGLQTGSFDIIISALSIHHFPDDVKRRVYMACGELLKPDGEFLNADEIFGETQALDERLCKLWHDFVRENTSEQEFTDFLDRTSVDIRTTLSEQLLWMNYAGFDADCIFKYGVFSVMYGKMNS